MEDSAAPYRQPELCGLPSSHGFQSVAGRTGGGRVHWREGSEGPALLMLFLTLVVRADRLAVQATGTSVLGSRLQSPTGALPP